MNRLVEYQDPIEGFRGWLAEDAGDSPIAAGGCRVQTQLDSETLGALAERMTLKQRVLGINVNGGKCGIAFDPRSSNKAEALRRFLAFLRDELMTRFSMGPDMGTQWGELQRIAASEAIPSVKYAIRSAQHISDEEFFARMALLDDEVGMLTLGQRRAGHVLAHTAVAAARAAGATGVITATLQGFGNLGRAAACSLLEEGVRVVAVSDEYGCMVNNQGLDLVSMLSSWHGLPVPQLGTSGEARPNSDIFRVPADVIILAANRDAISPETAATIPVGSVAVGANYGLSAQPEETLYRRGVVVVPDFIGGIGGSASMEAVFGPMRCPTAKVVLDDLARMSRDLVDDLCTTAHREGLTTSDAAKMLAARAKVSATDRPYGHCPYLLHRR